MLKIHVIEKGSVSNTCAHFVRRAWLTVNCIICTFQLTDECSNAKLCNVS